MAAGSRDGFRRAVQEASTRWAGATEPIIPVRKDGRLDELWSRVLRKANIDGLVDVDAGPGAQVLGARLGLDVVPIAEIDLWGMTQFSTHPANIGGFPQHVMPAIASSDAAPLWEVAAAGDLTAEHQALLTRSGVGVLRPRGPDGVARAALARTTLLDATVTAFAEYTGFNIPPAGPPWCG